MRTQEQIKKDIMIAAINAGFVKNEQEYIEIVYGNETVKLECEK